MPGTSDFLAFATNAGANVTSQATYAAEPIVGTGFQTGVAPSNDCNKVWRQATFPGAGVAQYIANQLNINVADDGNLTNFVTNLTAAIQVPATAAQAAAEAYAATAAGNAQSAAETFATAAANTAQTNAETYAAAQAATAQTNAQNFATTKAAAAQAAAETYAAAQASAAQSNAEAYAAAQASAAQSNAEAYALAQATAAKTAAETYANGTVNLTTVYTRVKFPGGAIRICGRVNLNAGPNVVAFPAGGFTTACVTVNIRPFGADAEVYPTAASTANFSCNVGVSETYMYQADGY